MDGLTERAALQDVWPGKGLCQSDHCQIRGPRTRETWWMSLKYALNSLGPVDLLALDPGAGDRASTGKYEQTIVPAGLLCIAV